MTLEVVRGASAVAAWLIFLSAGPAAADEEILAGPSATSEPEPKTEAIREPTPEPAQTEPWVIPPGFEDLMGPQTTVLDVYFHDQQVGEATATITPESIEFESPAEVVRLLSGIKDARRTEAALSGILPANAGSSCHPTPRKGCGALKVEVAGVILTADLFRVDVFVAPWLHIVSRLDAPRYLPPPDSGFSNLTNAQVAGTVSNSDAKIGMSIRNYASYNDLALVSHLSVSERTGFQIKKMTAERHVAGHRVFGGFFPLTAFGLVGGREILGFGGSISDQTRLDLREVPGTPIVLYLSQRSRVDIRRDDELLSSRLYEPGNQTIDTKSLPVGAYQVELEILDARGDRHSETRYFVKSPLLPPYDTTYYWSALGLLVDATRRGVISQPTGLGVLGGGARWRIMDPLAGSVDALISVNQSLIELGVAYHATEFMITTDLMLTTDGYWGNALAVNGQLWRFSGSVAWQIIFGAFGPAAGMEESHLKPTDPLLVDEPFGQMTTQVSYRQEPFVVNLRTSLRHDFILQRSHFIVGLDSLVYLYRGQHFFIQAGGSMTITPGEIAALLSINFDYGRSSWFVSGTTGGQVGAPGPDGSPGDPWYSALGSARVTWNDRDLVPEDLEGTAITNYRGGLASQRLIGSFEASGGFINVDTSFSDRAQMATLTAGSTLLISEKGIAAGGREANASGIVVEVKTSQEDAVFDIVVNRSVWGKVRANSMTPLLLSPFQQYRVHVVQEQGSMLQVDKPSRNVVLYPGNVVFLSWTASPMVVLLATVVGPDGEPFSRARVESSQEVASTDESGFFQLSALAGERIQLTKDGTKCGFAAPMSAPDDTGVVIIDRLVCEAK